MTGVRAMTVIIPARAALVAYFFSPLECSATRPRSRTARVCTLAASEPTFGSAQAERRQLFAAGQGGQELPLLLVGAH